MGHQSLDPARDIFNCKPGSHPTILNRIFMWLKLHMQLKNAIAGSQTELGSPAADLQVTFLEKESLYDQIASQPTSVSLHQR